MNISPRYTSSPDENFKNIKREPDDEKINKKESISITKNLDSFGELEASISSELECKGYQIPSKNVWKLLFMEREYLSNGKYHYEQEEPGYLEGMLNGYLFMLHSLDKPLTAELFKNLHDTCVKGVCSKDEPEGIPLGFRKYLDGGEAFGLLKGLTLSDKGVEELSKRYQTYKYIESKTNDLFFPLRDAMFNPQKTIIEEKLKPSIKLRPTREESTIKNIEFLLKEYALNLKNDPLCAIVRLCQDLDQFHFCVDGNIRTIGILVLHRELLREGLMPSVLSDVNMFDCLAEIELMQNVKEGQDFFSTLLKQ